MHSHITTKKKKVPTEDIALDCAALNDDYTCEICRTRDCEGCTFWTDGTDWDWDKEHQCPKSRLETGDPYAY